MEEWRHVSDFDNLYMVSNLGNVKSMGRIVHDSIGRIRLVKPKLLRPSQTSKRKNAKKGYLEVRLTHLNGDSENKLVHILVAQAFISNPLNKPTVNHKDGDKHNNCVNNLEWNTYSENNQHAYNKNLKSDNRFVGKFNLNPYELIDTYISLHEAARKNNISLSKVFKMCSKLKYNASNNFIFQYIPRTEIIEVSYEELLAM